MKKINNSKFEFEFRPVTKLFEEQAEKHPYIMPRRTLSGVKKNFKRHFPFQTWAKEVAYDFNVCDY